MVPKSTNERKTVKKKKLPVWGVIAVFCAMFVVAFVVSRVLWMFDNNVEVTGDIDESGCPTIDASVIESGECTGTGTVSVKKVDFQPVINEWVNAVGGQKGIIIYDLNIDEVVGEYNPDNRMRIESIYKLFVVYEGYRRVQSGEWNGEDRCGNTGWTILGCLDKAIRESSSTAAEALHGMIGYATLNDIVRNEFEIPNVTVESISATPREVMQMMKIFYDHTEITDQELIAQIKDSFLNQPPSAGLCSGPCDWRRGLPSGFSDRVNVYNKVGWLSGGSSWVYYDDAAIVDFIEADRKYIVVVLTSGGVTNKQIANFGTKLEEYFFSTY